MDTIDRLIEVRDALRLNQGEFASKLGLSQGAVSDFEHRKKALIERNLKLICLTFGVNENWLRTGKGEMFIKTPASPYEQPIYDKNGQPLSPEEGVFMGTYRKLTEPNKEVARTTVDALLKSQGKPSNETGGEKGVLRKLG